MPREIADLDPKLGQGREIDDLDPNADRDYDLWFIRASVKVPIGVIAVLIDGEMSKLALSTSQCQKNRADTLCCDHQQRRTMMATKKGSGGKSGGGRKQSSDRMASIGGRAMSTGKATPKQIRSLGASVVGQDETKGRRKK